MKQTFNEFQEEIENILQSTYGIKTTLEMRNHISFSYHFTDQKPAAVILEILIDFR